MTGLATLVDRVFEGDDAAALEIAGQRVGRYRILRRLGAGGAGLVLLAEDESLRRFVALKILPPRNAADPAARARFLQEARTAARLSHPHIATIHAVEDHDGIPLLAMEFVDGSTLRERLEKGPLAISEVERLGEGIAAALAKAHEAGIVHRDLKPENVLLDASGSPKVADFGLARSLRTLPIAGDAVTASGAVSLVGAILGTPRYMSPEQAVGDPVDERSDVFSFGVLLYELLAGAPPFDGRTFVDLASAIRSAVPVPITKRRTDTPPALASLVEACLAKEPAGRPPNGTALVAALAARTSATPARPRRRRGILAVAGIALAMAAAVLWNSRTSEPTSTRYLPVVSDDARAQAAFRRAVLSWYAGDDQAAARALEEVLSVETDDARVMAFYTFTSDRLLTMPKVKEVAGEKAGDDALLARRMAEAFALEAGAARDAVTRDLLALGGKRRDRFFDRLLATQAMQSTDPVVLDAILGELLDLSRLDPAVAKTHLGIGHRLVRLGRYEEAQRAFETGLDANPGNARLAAGLATALIAKKNHARARVILEQILERTPSDGGARVALTSVFLAIGDEHGRAREVSTLLAAPSLTKEVLGGLMAHVSELFARGRVREADELLERVTSAPGVPADFGELTAARYRVQWAFLLGDDAALRKFVEAKFPLGVEVLAFDATAVDESLAAIDLGVANNDHGIRDEFAQQLRAFVLLRGGRRDEALQLVNRLDPGPASWIWYVGHGLSAKKALDDGDRTLAATELRALAARREECETVGDPRKRLCQVVVADALSRLATMAAEDGDASEATRYRTALEAHWPDADEHHPFLTRR